MRKGGRLFIVLGVALALVAVALVAMTFVQGDDDGTTAAPKQAFVVKAAIDIPAGTIVRQEDVLVAEVSESDVVPNSATSTIQIVGQATTSELVEGQQIVMTNLTTPGLTNVISEGKRAAAIPLDRINALGGLIRAEDRVDLIFSTRLKLTRIVGTDLADVVEDGTYAFDKEALTVVPSGESAPGSYPIPGEDGSRFLTRDIEDGDPIAKLLLQDVRVLRVIAGDQAVGAPQSTQASSGTAQTDDNDTTSRLPASDLMILEVDPQQAEIIKFIQDNMGRFQVVLRGPQDHNTTQTTGVSFQILVDGYELPVPKSVRLPEGGQ